MISNPELAAWSSDSLRWPQRFTHVEVMSLVPSSIARLQEGGRMLELEVGSAALLSSLARLYPRSQFIGLSSQGRGPVEMTSRNLHFRAVERMELGRFRQVDLALALGGIRDHGLIAEVVYSLAPGGQFLLRERDRDWSGRRGGTRLVAADERWSDGDSFPARTLVQSLARSFHSLHTLRLPEDPGYLYYVARAA
jgi:hypothetical protein